MGMKVQFPKGPPEVRYETLNAGDLFTMIGSEEVWMKIMGYANGAGAVSLTNAYWCANPHQGKIVRPLEGTLHVQFPIQEAQP